MSEIAISRQLRLLILKFTDFRLTVRNANPYIGKVLLNEMWERKDGVFFGFAECRNPHNLVLSIPNLARESGDSSWNAHNRNQDRLRLISVTRMLRELTC